MVPKKKMKKNNGYKKKVRYISLNHLSIFINYY